jgi:hypothetical protein
MSRQIAEQFGLSLNVMRRRTRVPRRLEGDMMVTENIAIGRTVAQDLDAFLCMLASLANHYKVNIDDFNQEIIQMK